MDQHNSPTLETLDESRRPRRGTACEHCPNSVWFAHADQKAGLSCYCRVMYVIVWTQGEQQELLACDGMTIGQPQAKQE